MVVVCDEAEILFFHLYLSNDTFYFLIFTFHGGLSVNEVSTRII